MARRRLLATTVILAALMVAALPRTGFAERLFAPSADAPARARGIARVQMLDLDAGVLANLRGAPRAVLTDFPLGGDGTATVVVERFQPFADDARAEVVTAAGTHEVALPDRAYFRGQVDGDEQSLVVVIAGPDFARGFVATAGTVYRFGRDGGGRHRSWAVRDADPAAFRAPATMCGNDAHVDLVRQPVGRTSAPSIVPAPRGARFAPTLMVEVAIETDQELRGHFASDAEALDYLADLAAAVSAIYDADTDVRVVFRFIRLWNTTDPWSATTTGGMLGQVQSYWISNQAGTTRDTVHFVSGKTVVGGIAFVDVLCNPVFGYAVSTVYGAFDLMDPADIWDVLVFAHELGHNFGSHHTHCYDPPVDTCHSGEQGCYTGPESLPPGGGTIMSYCHQLGGFSNVNLVFGPTVSGVLRAGADGAMCLGPPCGDGILDPEEECDDGNVDDDDCCSSTCVAQVEGGPCDDREDCTASDTCTAGTCGGTPLADGTPCDDGTACTVDVCQTGVCVSAAIPSTGCKLPTLPGKAQLVFKDKTPDTRDLAVWKWTKGAATDVADFGAPTASESYELCVYDGTSSLIFAARIPAAGTCGNGECWKVTGTGFLYKDKAATSDGVTKLQLKAGAAGAAKVLMKGKGENLATPVLPLALPLRVQLENAAQCWEATYSTALKNEPALFKAKSD